MQKGRKNRRAAVIPIWVPLALALFPTAAHAASCSGELRGGAYIAGKTPYDPFSPQDLLDLYSLSVTNTGTRSCVFAIRFVANSLPVKLGRTLAYSLSDLNGARLLQTDVTQTSSTVLKSAPVGPNGVYPFQFALGICRGQFARPGQYSDGTSVSVQLFSVEDNRYILLQTKAFSVSYTVAVSSHFNLTGGGVATTVDFSDLARDAQRSVILQARSNTAYAVSVTSQNRQAMKLTPPIPGHPWQIPYQPALNGSTIALNAGAATRTFLPSSIAGDNHLLTVKVGDTRHKRAGVYQDVLTIGIEAALP
jgi:hypothetical protein